MYTDRGAYDNVTHILRCYQDVLLVRRVGRVNLGTLAIIMHTMYLSYHHLH